MFFILLATSLLVSPPPARAQSDEVLVLDGAQTAVLDPGNWDRVFAGARYFDALRAMLVRFPGAAEAVQAKLGEGYEIEKAELVLRWEKQEGAGPERGRHGWGANELYENRPGKWSAVAQALQRPWSIDEPAQGPTFNAWMNGTAWWSRGGARGDGADRNPARFGPLPLNPDHKDAAFDLTPLLNESAYGEDLGRRLRNLEECGFQILKNELYDMSYRSFYAYDWSVSTGYMRIWVQPPELRISFRKAAPVQMKLPPASTPSELAERLQAKDEAGSPSICFPDDLGQKVARLLARPAGVPDWQWRRIEELRALHTDPADSALGLGRGFNFSALFSNNKENYFACIERLMLTPPRTWIGHLSSDLALLAAGYNSLLPSGAQDHLALYWDAWLMPQVESGLDADLGGGTHRGGPTYFRGYTRSMGTMNFVHNAIMGALLGGQYIHAPYVLANARYGLENTLLRIYSFGDGAHQEIGDTYYQALTIAGAGAIARYAENPFDRLVGLLVRDRLLEPLISMYHPGLRRMTHPMGRGSYTYHLLLQEGPYHVLHTLSPSGTLVHLDDLKPERKGTPGSWGSVHALAILGNEGSPERIGLLAPWVDPRLADPMAGVVDGKTFPWRVFARDSSPGCKPGGWHVNYLDENFALASRDNANHDYGVTSVIGQWRRKAAQVTRMDDLSTILLSMGCNGRFAKENQSMGAFGIVQKDNKLVAMKMLPEPDRKILDKEEGGVRALHATAAIISFGDASKREVWINDKRSEELSGAREDPGGDWRTRMASAGAIVHAKDGDVIAIRDGVTYVGIVPAAVNPMARDHAVEISYEYPTLLVHANLYRAAEPLDIAKLYATDTPPAAGFVLEIADADDFRSFEEFRKHIRAAALDLAWDREAGLARLEYRSGEDKLEMGFNPLRVTAEYRAVNGKWPYLPDGVKRESEWAIQGSAGRIEKAGAALVTEPGREAYLQVLSRGDVFIAYNPVPDPTLWDFTLPDGRRLRADGRLGLARVTVVTGANRVSLDTALKPGQDTPDMATALLAFDWPNPPVVERNGEVLKGKLNTLDIDGKKAYVIPLRDGAEAGDIELFRRFEDKMAVTAETYLLDWQVAGPLPPEFELPGDKEPDLAAVYPGFDEGEVRWQRIRPDGDGPLGFGAVDLEALFTPGRQAKAYAFARIRSDADRKVTLFFGSEMDAAIWVNGENVLTRPMYYRRFMPDQDRLTIALKKGDNTVLIRSGRTYESWKFSFRLADEFGLVLETGVVYDSN